MPSRFQGGGWYAKMVVQNPVYGQKHHVSGHLSAVCAHADFAQSARRVHPVRPVPVLSRIFVRRILIREGRQAVAPSLAKVFGAGRRNREVRWRTSRSRRFRVDRRYRCSKGHGLRMVQVPLDLYRLWGNALESDFVRKPSCLRFSQAQPQHENIRGVYFLQKIV